MSLRSNKSLASCLIERSTKPLKRAAIVALIRHLRAAANGAEYGREVSRYKYKLLVGLPSKMVYSGERQFLFGDFHFSNGSLGKR